MDSIPFWINPVLVVGIGSLLWGFLIERFDRIDKQFGRIDTQLRELTREVVANGKNIDLIEGCHEGHSGPPYGSARAPEAHPAVNPSAEVIDSFPVGKPHRLRPWHGPRWPGLPLFG